MNSLMRLSSASILLMLLVIEPSLQAPSRKLNGECKCPSEKDSCMCALMGLVAIPSNTMKNCSKWTKIDFSFNSIPSLPANSFSAYKCDRVEKLSIFYNGINGTLGTGAFNGLPNLRYLNLSRNEIGTLKGKPFESCSKLMSLDLSSNKIRVISKTIFNGIPDLQVINLFGNFIGFIDRGAFSLQSLKRLELAQNNITQLQKGSFEGLTNLQHLNLLSNPVKDIEKGLFDQMPNLVRLTIGQCGKLGGFDNLKSGLFPRLGKLIEFNLTDCLVNNIEMNAFSGLKSVQRLSLRLNRLAKIARSLWNPMQALQYLDLSKNQLTCISEFNFDSLKSLKELNLADNHITFLSDYAFRGLAKLDSLILNGNPLRFVQIDSFCALTTLSILSLRNVKVNYIITSDDKNSSLTGAIASLPVGLKVDLNEDSGSLRGLGSGCKSAKTVVASPSANVSCPVYLGYDTFPPKPNSRQYLLIIIGVCVSFLLMAMAVILCYRAWSKRKRTACEKAEQAAMEEEKQEMVEKPSGANAQANGGSATTELLAAGQSAENGVVLHHMTAKPGQPETASKEEESTMTHLAVV